MKLISSEILSGEATGSLHDGKKNHAVEQNYNKQRDVLVPWTTPKGESLSADSER